MYYNKEYAIISYNETKKEVIIVLDLDQLRLSLEPYNAKVMEMGNSL